MKFQLLETVVLLRDMPEHGLRAGDLGVVVEVYGPEGLEVEFVTASGRAQAVSKRSLNFDLTGSSPPSSGALRGRCCATPRVFPMLRAESPSS